MQAPPIGTFKAAAAPDRLPLPNLRSRTSTFQQYALGRVWLLSAKLAMFCVDPEKADRHPKWGGWTLSK